MTTDLTAAFRQVFGTPPTWTLPRDLPDASHEDEDSLRRSFGGLSRSARRQQRRPRVQQPNEPWTDDLAVALGDVRSEELER